MRFLFLTKDLETVGGGSRNAGNLVRAWRALGHEVEVLGYDGNFWRYARRARAAARSADIVHAVDINPLGFAGYLATRFMRAKLVIIAQAAYAVAPLYSPKAAYIARHVYRAADGVVSGSAYVAGEIRKKVPGLSIAVIDPGIDLAQFPDAEEGAYAPLDPPFMIGVGGLKARKGYDVAIRALALIVKKMPRVRYAIVGSPNQDPGYARSLRELARELGVEANVDFLGEISDEKLKELYQSAALFLLPSTNDGLHFEGFGMVFLEAAAYGLPAIGTQGNGIADAVENGATGFLVPQHDPEATAAAVEKILSDPALAARMSARARVFAREHDLAHIERAYAVFYRSLVGSSSA